MWDRFDLFVFDQFKKLPGCDLNLCGVPFGEYLWTILIMIIVGELILIKVKKVNK